MDYRASHMAPEKGAAYHVASRSGYRALVWEWEKERLSHVLGLFPAGRSLRVLDFACGTGRIAEFLEGAGHNVTGVDVSESMLAVARKRLARTEIIHDDITRHDGLGERRFDLITAFRFMLNAQQSLREEAIAVLARHLADDGYLVFNNHLQSGSIPQRALAAWSVLLRKTPGPGLSMRETRRLVEGAGLKIVDVYHWGIVPTSRDRVPTPAGLLTRFEGWVSRIAMFRSLARHTIVVCARSA